MRVLGIPIYKHNIIRRGSDEGCGLCEDCWGLCTKGLWSLYISYFRAMCSTTLVYSMGHFGPVLRGVFTFNFSQRPMGPKKLKVPLVDRSCDISLLQSCCSPVVSCCTSYLPS